MGKKIDDQEIVDIQNQINQLQQELHDEVEASDVGFELKKNPIFESRNDVIAGLIASKHLPDNFWANTLVALLQLKAEAEEKFPHFLGPYDEELLSKYMKGMKLNYTEKGHKISLFFAPNPYFKETELWAEVLDVMPPEGGSAKLQSDDEEVCEETINFSGVTWNPGYGPESDGEESQDGKQEDTKHNCAKNDETHKKSFHEKPAADNLPGSNSHGEGKQGPSVLEVFSLMPPHPEEDSELCSGDDEEEVLTEAVNEWEDEMEDRNLLLSTIVEAYHDPGVVWTNVRNFKDLEMALKKVKTE